MSGLRLRNAARNYRILRQIWWSISCRQAMRANTCHQERAKARCRQAFGEQVSDAIRILFDKCLSTTCSRGFEYSLEGAKARYHDLRRVTMALIVETGSAWITCWYDYMPKLQNVLKVKCWTARDRPLWVYPRLFAFITKCDISCHKLSSPSCTLYHGWLIFFPFITFQFSLLLHL